MAHDSLTQQELKKVLRYDPDSGLFFWLDTAKNRPEITLPAGYISRGYIRIRVGAYVYRAHRLAWLYVYGEWPQNEMDHINHNRADNRIANLRAVTKMENAQNRKLNPRSSSGINGISMCVGARETTWRVNFWSVAVPKKRRNRLSRSFKTLAKAISYRKKLELRYGFHENHGRPH